MIPRLSAAGLSLGLGAGQPGFGQRPVEDEDNENNEILRKRKLAGVTLNGQPLSPAAMSIGLGVL